MVPRKEPVQSDTVCIVRNRMKKKAVTGFVHCQIDVGNDDKEITGLIRDESSA